MIISVFFQMRIELLHSWEEIHQNSIQYLYLKRLTQDSLDSFFKIIKTTRFVNFNVNEIASNKFNEYSFYCMLPLTVYPIGLIILAFSF